jgi:hypothetical protein
VLCGSVNDEGIEMVNKQRTLIKLWLLMALLLGFPPVLSVLDYVFGGSIPSIKHPEVVFVVLPIQFALGVAVLLGIVMSIKQGRIHHVLCVVAGVLAVFPIVTLLYAAFWIMPDEIIVLCWAAILPTAIMSTMAVVTIRARHRDPLPFFVPVSMRESG